MIIDHTAPNYLQMRAFMDKGTLYNGAYYYSKEITARIIPNVKTERSWVTLNIDWCACDNAIVFIHNNKNSRRYDWLKAYKNLVLVCGIPETCDKVAHLGASIYLPLSVDVEAVKRIAGDYEKTKDVAFVGRSDKRLMGSVPDGTPCIEDLPREELLREMARYRRVYAVGRTAIEAKILGCEVLPYDPRFPNPDVWEVIDNLEAARLLQEELDEIDGGENGSYNRIEED